MKAAKVPSTTEAQAVSTAIFNDRPKPLMISVSFISSAYQRTEKPLHTMSCRELLKEKTINTRIGR